VTDLDRLEQRLAAIERTVVDGDHDGTLLEDTGSSDPDIEQLESRLDALDSRVADLESTVQAIDGYVSKVESVNEAVERRSDSAMATVDRLEQRLEEVEAVATDTAVPHTEPEADGSERSDAAETIDGRTNHARREEPPSVEQTSQESDPDERGFGGSIRQALESIRGRLS